MAIRPGVLDVPAPHGAHAAAAEGSPGQDPGRMSRPRSSGSSGMYIAFICGFELPSPASS